MSLKDIDLKKAYSSDFDDILYDFYIPALEASTQYDRIAGFFSSTSLAIAARGILGLIKKGGVMKLIVSSKLTKRDLDIIVSSYKEPEKYIEEKMLEELDKLEDKFVRDHVLALGWMIANKKLDIKVAVVYDKKEKPLSYEDIQKKGIFHQKVGILKDSEGNTITFSGSVNETSFGWLNNIEEFKVFRSWNSSEEEYIKPDILKFNRFWNNQSKRAKIMDIPSAVKNKFIEISPRNIEKINLEKWYRKSERKETKVIQDKWRHQKEAKDTFLNKKNGVVEMATGTGKTRLAITILNHLFNNGKIDGAIVTTFGNDLLDQWYYELIERADKQLIIYRDYETHHELSEFLINPQSAILLINWQNLNRALKRKDDITPKLLICDEVHGFGSEVLRKKLGGKVREITYRLGLSATPEREYDEVGTTFIEEEIGPVIFRFNLENAIKRGILCEFNYKPLSYRYTSEDKENIKLAYRRYNAKIKAGEHEDDAKKALYIDLSRVRKLSKNKIPVFRDFIKKHSHLLEDCIIFVETMEYGKLVQDVIIHYESDFHTYYADDEKENLKKFSRGEFKLLITCKRISQGIDIKSVKNIILFSASRAKLETIQRMGRCLRIDPLNPNKRATIVDFILSNKDQTDNEEYEDADEVRKAWLIDISKTKRTVT